MNPTEDNQESGSNPSDLESNLTPSQRAALIQMTKRLNAQKNKNAEKITRMQLPATKNPTSSQFCDPIPGQGQLVNLVVYSALLPSPII
jgi:hypothetical protein